LTDERATDLTAHRTHRAPCPWVRDQHAHELKALEIAMKELVIILLICCGVATSSAQAIECLSVPNQSESGWWSWREIEGRKCWYKKVGEVPPKSEFIWPEHTKEATPEADPTQQELSSMRAPEATTTTLPQIEIARVKPVDLSAPNFRLSDGLIDLMKGFSLAGFQGIGGAWDTPPYIALPADTFDARYGPW
jgi:hypothetical protein